MISPEDYALYRRLRAAGACPAEAVHLVRMRRGFRAITATMQQITDGMRALGRALAPAVSTTCRALLKLADEVERAEARRVAAMRQHARRKGRLK